MTMTLRIVVIVVSVLTTAMILRKIRQSKLQIEDSIFWIGFSSILILFSVFPCVPDFLSRLEGTYTTANFIYLAVIFLLILKMFHMSIKMSQLETKIKELAQEMALSEHERAVNEAACAAAFPAKQRKKLEKQLKQERQTVPAEQAEPETKTEPETDEFLNWNGENCGEALLETEHGAWMEKDLKKRKKKKEKKD